MNLIVIFIGELIVFMVFVFFCMKYVWLLLNGVIEVC